MKRIKKYLDSDGALNVTEMVSRIMIEELNKDILNQIRSEEKQNKIKRNTEKLVKYLKKKK